VQKFSFSGHETFVCKQYWLKKGFDFINSKKSFTEESSVVDLGVGKNMVASIRFWMKSFNLLDNTDNLTDFAKYVFGKKGKDPYVEDIGTLWLLHYFLVKTSRASIYHLFFNEFSSENTYFEKENIIKFILRKLQESNINNVNSKTIEKDINVLIRSYYKDENTKDIEEDSINLLNELEMIKKDKKHYYFNHDNKQDIPEEILFFTILDFLDKNEKTVSINRICYSDLSPGKIFLLNKPEIIEKIRLLESKFSGIVYSSQAGIETVQLKKTFGKWGILDDYYRN